MPEVENEDPVMTRVRAEYDRRKVEDGWTLDKLGLAMGFTGDTARKAAFQFLKAKAPRIDSLRRFAAAIGITLVELLAEPKSIKSKK